MFCCFPEDSLGVWAGMRSRGNGPRGGFKSGCKGGYRRLAMRLGGNVWRVQTGWGALGAGRSGWQYRPSRQKGGRGGPSPLQAQAWVWQCGEPTSRRIPAQRG